MGRLVRGYLHHGELAHGGNRRLGDQDAPAVPQGEHEAGEHPRHEGRVLEPPGAHLEGAAARGADGKDFGDGEIGFELHRGHADLGGLSHLHLLPVVVVDLALDLEAVRVVQGRQSLPGLGQVPHRGLALRHHPGRRRLHHGIALQGGGLAYHRLGRLIAGLHGPELLGAGGAFLEEELVAFIVRGDLIQLRLGLAEPGLELRRRQGHQRVSRLDPGAGLHPDFHHPAGNLGRHLGQARGDHRPHDLQLAGNLGFLDDQDAALEAAAR